LRKVIGIDTSFLAAWAIPEHPAHQQCRGLLAEAVDGEEAFGLTSGILAEFIHVVIDPRRFARPLEIESASAIARFWVNATEVQLLPRGQDVTRQWLDWLAEHRLGRKRLLDTLLAATWHVAGIQDIYTLNPAEFAVFKQFTVHPQQPD
jgi:predicted nucleic acid-binding protein